MLVSSAEAMGRCALYAVDAASGEAMRVAPEVTVCGASGTVVGWTLLG